jgi:hypothetical protein
MDTSAAVSILGTGQFGSLECKPPIKSQVSLMQAGSDDQLRGFLV